ncbi:unnamed protein product [Arctogadus glacialis]
MEGVSTRTQWRGRSLHQDPVEGEESPPGPSGGGGVSTRTQWRGRSLHQDPVEGEESPPGPSRGGGVSTRTQWRGRRLHQDPVEGEESPPGPSRGGGVSTCPGSDVTVRTSGLKPESVTAENRTPREAGFLLPAYE